MDKTKKALNEGGLGLLFKRSLRFAYNEYLIEYMPKRKGRYNDVKVYSAEMFSDALDLRRRNNPEYEEGMVNNLHKYAESGDEITIIGGGIGVTTVHAARITEPGKVTVYEASEECCDKIATTLWMNDVEGVNLENSIVGNKGELFGEEGDADRMEPSELPESDVLEIDVEGAEIPILEQLEIDPDIILVESHGFLDSPTEEVENTLESIGYKILEVREAETKPHLQQKDIKIIVAKDI